MNNWKRLVSIFIISLILLPVSAKQSNVGKGYTGHLPDISKFFQYKKKEVKSPPQKDIKIEDLNEDNLIDAPMNDDLFLDVIIQKQKPSQYISDLLDILKILEKFRTTLQNEPNLQQFNANVNLLDLHVSKLERDYAKTSEALSESYNNLLEINYYAKLLGNLKYEANYYSKYQAPLENQYTPEYIKEQDEFLLQEMNKTIFLLKSECDKGSFKND